MNIEEMLVTILQKINSIEKKMDSIEARMDSIEKRMDSIEERIDTIESRLNPLEALPQQVKEIQMTLENVICKDIKIIAEGHLDLDRKLDKALEFQKEKEVFLLRVTALEGDVQRIKNRIGMTV